MTAILALYADARRKPLCAEKTPGHLWRLDSLLSDFPKAKIVCMMRDGRDVAVSMASMPWWSLGLMPAAEAWVRAADLADTYQTQDPDRFLVVRYEDLVRTPTDVTAALMAFLDLELEPGQFDAHIPSDVVLARNAPWKGRALESIDDSRIDHWRGSVSEAEAREMNALMAPHLSRFGYKL